MCKPNYIRVKFRDISCLIGVPFGGVPLIPLRDWVSETLKKISFNELDGLKHQTLHILTLAKVSS